MKRALIVGVAGQDGSYLAELLLKKEYQVYGVVRRHNGNTYWRLAGILDSLKLIHGDLTDPISLEYALERSRPDEIYNLASQSHVGQSFTMPLATIQSTGMGAIHLFEAIRQHAPLARVYQASSSEQFGKTAGVNPPTLNVTPMLPCSPYGCAKLLAHQAAGMYREAYDLRIACGVAFNHESERRGEEFVTRKITKAAARIKHGLQHVLRLGSLAVSRDWSYAPDVMAAAWRMLQCPEPRDYILASGETHTLEEFLTIAFSHIDLNYSSYVVEDHSYVRPLDVSCLKANPQPAIDDGIWQPTVGFQELVIRMVEADLAALNHRPLQTA